MGAYGITRSRLTDHRSTTGRLQWRLRKCVGGTDPAASNAGTTNAYTSNGTKTATQSSCQTTTPNAACGQPPDRNYSDEPLQPRHKPLHPRVPRLRGHPRKHLFIAGTVRRMLEPCDYPQRNHPMTLKHVRICTHCGIERWAPCSIVCRVPDENNPRSWVEVVDCVEGVCDERSA